MLESILKKIDEAKAPSVVNDLVEWASIKYDLTDAKDNAAYKHMGKKVGATDFTFKNGAEAEKFLADIEKAPKYKNLIAIWAHSTVTVTWFVGKANEASEETKSKLKPLVNVTDDVPNDWIYAPSENKNYDTVYFEKHKDIEEIYQGTITKKFGHPNKAFSYTKIETFDVEENKSRDLCKKEMKKYMKKGFEVLTFERTGMKGQDWKGLIYKYGQMHTAIMVKR